MPRNLLVTFRIALRALAKNKMRAGLTILGVVIGIAAVMTMVSVGQSAGALVQGEINSFGPNLIFVFPGSIRGGAVRHGRGTMMTLTAEDATAIRDECASVLATSPMIMASAQVVYGDANWRPRDLLGTGPDYLAVRNWEVRHGGFFTDRDIASATKVCVIGRTIVAKLFQTTNPLGKTIRIRNIPFRVIGVLEERGADMVGQDQDDVIIAPFTTLRKRLRGSPFDNVDLILVAARSTDVMDQAKDEVSQLLCDRHRIPPGQPADFGMQDMTQISDFVTMVTGSMTALLASIAGISLLVGGVGIMNIMLVSVTERTREIGIRLAVGARGIDILLQFLVESVLLSSIGGAIGIALGTGASIGITRVINSLLPGTEWPVVVSIPAAIIALGFSAAVGIFFGFFPAWRASRLDPIDALRYE